MPERITPPWALILEGGGLTSAFLEFVAGANPGLYGAFAPLAARVGTRQEPRTGVRPAWIDRVRLAEAS